MTVDLTTRYLGLELANPLVASPSPVSPRTRGVGTGFGFGTGVVVVVALALSSWSAGGVAGSLSSFTFCVASVTSSVEEDGVLSGGGGASLVGGVDGVTFPTLLSM